MCTPIKVEFIRCPELNPYWQYYAEGEGFVAVGGEEKFCDTAKDAASSIEWSKE